jgi:hypothetical protein
VHGKLIQHVSGHLSVGVLAALVLFAVGTEPARSSEGGFSSYVPGLQDSMAGVLPPPGWYVTEYLYNYSGCTSREEQEGTVRVNVRAETPATFTLISQVTEHKLLGSDYGWGILVPLIRARLKGEVVTASGSEPFNQGVTGLSETEIIPLALGWHHGRSHQRTMLVIYAPTGQYSTSSLVTAGLNRWAVGFDYGYTFMDPKTLRELTVAPGYVISFTNRETAYLSGQEFHADFAAVQHYETGLGVGIVGYALVQTTPDRGSGANLGPFKGRALALGPIVLYNTTVGHTQCGVTAKYYGEFDVKNRFAGRAYWLNLSASF